MLNYLTKTSLKLQKFNAVKNIKSTFNPLFSFNTTSTFFIHDMAISRERKEESK